MYEQNVFIPNYPPPPITSELTYTNQPHNSTKIYENRLEEYLKVFEQRKISRQFEKQQTIKLSDVTREIRQCYDSIESLRNEISIISTNKINSTEAQWNLHFVELNEKVNQLQLVANRLTSSQSQIQKAIQKRKQKRDNIRKQKIETRKIRQMQQKHREEKHRIIDQWLEKNTQESAEEKRRIETEKRVGKILSDVKRRKIEAEKQILLFESLKELHRLRFREKPTTSSDVDKFNREIDDLKLMWQSELKKYNTEENTLCDLINDDNHFDEWHKVFYGTDIKQHDSFTVGQNSLSQLIEIRRLWDKCIVSPNRPFASTIPIGLVTPNRNPTKKWKIYQKTQNLS